MKNEFEVALNDNLSAKILKSWKHVSSQGGQTRPKDSKNTSRTLLKSSAMSASGLPYPGVSRSSAAHKPAPVKEELDWETSFNRLSDKT